MEHKKTEKIDVAILGATGMVGQKFIQLLDNHPYFRVAELFASEKSGGKTLDEATKWMVSDSIPQSLNGVILRDIKEIPKSILVFSALPSDIAKEAEPRCAKHGKIVISKSSAMRYESDVPILVPEINSEHLDMLNMQKKNRMCVGCIITDPNCTTTILAITLAPLMQLGIEEVMVSTMQALSGAGFPGVASLSINDNVIPYISGEEEKVAQESKKILGEYKNGKIIDAKFNVFASCNRVPVIDGHTENVHIRFKSAVAPEEAEKLMRGFTSLPQKLVLPSAPKHPIIVRKEPDRPQPRIDREAGRGMSVTVGRVRQGINEKSIAYTVCGHNTVRGAAGAGILDAELLVKTGIFERLTTNSD